MSTESSFSKSDVLANFAVGAVDDLTPDEAFAGVLDNLKLLLDVPYAHVLLDPEALAWFVPGMDADDDDRHTPTVLCRQVVALGRGIEVADLQQADAYATMPFVTGLPGLRFYTGIPLRSDSGGILGALCVMGRRPRILDVRERAVLRGAVQQVSIQLELRRALESARRADRYRARLNLLATQDFSEPLSRITTVLGTLRQSPVSREDLELIGLAEEAARTLTEDLKRVLDATALSADRDSPAKRTVALDEVLRDLSDEWRHRASLHGATLAIDTCALKLETNPELLARALGNLVSAALERKASEVHVQVRREQDDVSIHLQARGGGIRSGMTEAARSDVARDLAALNPSTFLGLSVSIAKRCCDVLGYRLSVATALDIGSDYTIHIPPAAVRGPPVA